MQAVLRNGRLLVATALSLHAVGIECEVFEQSRDIRESGL